jgi:ubiquinone biosynthesis protein COQ4
MSRFQEALRAANNLRLLAAVGRSGGDLNNVADLIDNFLDSPQMAASVERLRALPGGAALLEQRYRPCSRTSSSCASCRPAAWAAAMPT